MGFLLWDRYAKTSEERLHHVRPDQVTPAVAYVSHLMGALAGLTVGIITLRTFEQKLHTRVLWWASLVVSGFCTLLAVVWNLLH